MEQQTRRVVLRYGIGAVGIFGFSTAVTGQNSQTIETTGPQAVPAAEDATIAGTTSLPGTTTITVHIRSTSGVSPSFQDRRETTPTDGEWAVNFDLSITDSDAQFTLLVYADGQRYLEETWDVVASEQLFSVDSVELRNAETGALVASTAGDGWTGSVEPLELATTQSLQVRGFDGGDPVFYPRGGSLNVDTTGSLETSVSTETVTLTANEVGEASLTITIQSTYGETYEAPPLPIMIVESQAAGADNASTNESTRTPDEETETTNSQNEEGSSTVNTSETATSPQQPAETSDSTPGFTGVGALAGVVAFASLCRKHLTREQHE
jgi:hypothetical protein